MAAEPLSWIDTFFGPATPRYNGADLPVRPTVEYDGSSVSVADDPTNKRTVVTIAGVPSTAPLFLTSINLNNPANTFKYVVTPAAIAADRTLTLPLLAANDTLVCEAFAQTLTNKTIVAASNTITDTSATTGDILRHNGTRFVRLARGTANQVLTTNGAGTDIAWAAAAGGGSSAGASGQIQASDGAGAFVAASNVLAGVSGGGFVSIGATPANTGSLRLPNASGVSARNSGNSADYSLLTLDASNYATFGDAAGGAYIQTQQGGNDTILAQTSYGIVVRIISGLINLSLPTCGGPGAWGAVDGMATVAVSTTNITLTAAEYSRRMQKFTGAPAATRTITYPLPASDDECYEKIIWGSTTVSGLTITNGGGTTVAIGTGSVAHVLWFSQSGVVQIT